MPCRCGAVEWGFVVASGVLHVCVLRHPVCAATARQTDGGLPRWRGAQGRLLSSLVAITLLGEQISALGLWALSAWWAGCF